MAINERLIDTEVAAAGSGGAGTGNQEEGLILHLDANDVDSYDGDGSEWVDITDHEYTPANNVSEHFNTVLHNGNSSGTTRQITGVGFQPDLVITKARNATQINSVYDSVRGVGNGVNSAGERMLSTSLTNGQSGFDGRVNGYISSFDSDGFTATKGTGSGFYYFNRGSYNYVNWCFKAGGAAVSNTDGSITSQVSANNDLGFSIVEYTGTASGTVGHGLSVPPEFIITKRTGADSSWQCYHKSLGKDKLIQLNSNGANISISNYWGASSPDASVFRLSTNSGHDPANGENIAYCFASKRGVSKVGSYWGTSAAGNKVYTGFEPAFIMIKRADGVQDWWIVDNKTSTTSGEFNQYLRANTTGTTATPSTSINIHRDGFSFNGVSFNNNSQHFIYYAVAKSTNETSLIPDKDNFTAGSVLTTDLELNLDANSYSGSGNWLDGTSNDYDGTITGATYVNNDSADYFNFDGSNDEVRLNSGNNISASTFNNCTFEYWVKLDNLLESRHLYFHDFTSNNANFIGLSKSNTNNKLMVFGSSAHINIARGNTDLVTNKWTHIAVTLTSSELKIYIDGELDATVSQSFNGFSSPLYGSIGNDRRGQSTAGTKWLNGQVSQVRIYSSVLTQEQIKSNYDATRIYNAVDLDLHLDAASFPQYGESGYSNTPSTWTALSGSNATISGATFDSELGNYLDFDGSNDYVEIGSASSIIPAGNAFSVEVWVNAKSNTENKYWGVVSATNGTSPYGGWMIYNHYTEDTWGISMNKSGTWTSLSSGVSIVKDKWEHLVYTYDGSFMKLYVSGELRFNSSQSGSLQYNSGSQNIYIGRNFANYSPIKVGQVRIYGSLALTQDQIRQNYNFTKRNYPNGFNATINGAFGNAVSGFFQFDGSNDDIDLTSSHPYSSNAVQTNSVKSITGWVKLDSGTRAMLYTVSSINNGNDYFTCQVRNDSNGVFIQCRDGGTTNSFLDRATNSAPDSNWHHYVFQLDGDERQIYIDGVKRTITKSNAGSATDSSWISYPSYSSSVKHRIQKGREASAYYGTGKISKTKHYTRALTQAEITALYNEGE